MSEASDEDVRQRLRQCAHDLNNVLGQILGFGSLLVNDVEAAKKAGQVPDRVVDYARELLAAGLRGEGVAKRLSSIVRSMPADIQRDDASPAMTTPSAPSSTTDADAGLQKAGCILIAGTGLPEGGPVARALKGAGWRTEAEASGADALRRFRSNPGAFEAVVAYPSAPEIPGIDLIAAIKALKPLMVCILVLTDDGAVDEAAARFSGADACLAADASAVEIVSMVDRLGKRRGA